MRLLAIDPGPEESAGVLYDTDTGLPVRWAKVGNDEMRHQLDVTQADVLAVEMVASYGMAVGATVFETCVWSGRFIERWLSGETLRVVEGVNAGATYVIRRPEPLLVYRRDVKLHLCASARAKDANIRAALIDRYGPGKAKAVGLKASPGPLYGMAGDCWSALGVAVTAAETRLEAVAA